MPTTKCGWKLWMAFARWAYRPRVPHCSMHCPTDPTLYASERPICSPQQVESERSNPWCSCSTNPKRRWSPRGRMRLARSAAQGPANSCSSDCTAIRQSFGPLAQLHCRLRAGFPHRPSTSFGTVRQGGTGQDVLHSAPVPSTNCGRFYVSGTNRCVAAPLRRCILWVGRQVSRTPNGSTTPSRVPIGRQRKISALEKGQFAGLVQRASAVTWTGSRFGGRTPAEPNHAVGRQRARRSPE